MSQERVFEYMPETRWYVGPISEQARQWADGDPAKEAAAAFGAFLRERDIKIEWNPDEPMKFVVGGFFAVEVVLVDELAEDGSIPANDSSEWSFYVSTQIDGCLLLMGASHTQTGRIVPTQMLSAPEWLRGVGQIGLERREKSLAH